MIRVGRRGVLRVTSLSFVVTFALGGARSTFSEDPAVPGASVVEGRVRGPHHDPIGGIEVRLRAGSKTLDVSAVSNPDGTFRLGGADAWTLPADVPNSISSRTTEQLHEQNNPVSSAASMPHAGHA